MNLINYYLKNNPYYLDGRWLSGSAFKGFFLHSVGCPQPDPMVFIKNWNKASYTNAGVNGFIGADAVYITAPCLETKGKVKRMPHAGSPANNNYIGFEMTETNQISYTSGVKFTIKNKEKAVAHAKATYNNAVELFAKLCEFHGKDPLAKGVIMSHHEGALAGIATNHGDPEHYWKGLGLSYTMDTFRKAVSDLIKKHKAPKETLYRIRLTWKNKESQVGAYKDLNTAKKQCPVGYSVFDENGKSVYTNKPSVRVEEDEDMTQEKFNEMMNTYLANEAKKEPTWEKEYMEWAVAQGYLSGDEKGRLMAKKFMTRGEFATVLKRVCDKLGK